MLLLLNTRNIVHNLYFLRVDSDITNRGYSVFGWCLVIPSSFRSFRIGS